MKLFNDKKFFISLILFCSCLTATAFSQTAAERSREELQEATVLQLKTHPQLKQLRVFSLNHVVLTSSDGEGVGSKADVTTAAMIDTVIDKQKPTTSKLQEGIDGMIHFIPICDSDQCEQLLGVVEMIFIFPSYTNERARSLRANSRGMFVKESLSAGISVTKDLQPFMVKFQHNFVGAGL